MANRTTARDRDRRAAQAEAHRRHATRAQRKRQLLAIGGIVLVLLLVGAFILAAFNSSSGTVSSGTTATTASADGSTTVSDGPTVTTPVGTHGATLTGATPCPATDGSSPRTTQFAQPPPTCIDLTQTYDAVMQTSVGSFTFYLNTKLAPQAVNNFIVLARYHYYDGTTFSSITSQTVAQGGAVTNADGSPGPGYTLPAEYAVSGSTTGVVLTPGTLALAPTSDTDDSVGGQILITLGDKEASLPGTTTVMGLMLADGPNNTLHQLDSAGTQAGGPTKVITITSVKIELAPVTSTTATP